VFNTSLSQLSLPRQNHLLNPAPVYPLRPPGQPQNLCHLIQFHLYSGHIRTEDVTEVDGMALARGFDQATDEMLRPFFYLSFMHSQLLADQDRSVRLHEAFGDPERLRYAISL
jgi:Bacterial protein of unknown function (DUF924)